MGTLNQQALLQAQTLVVSPGLSLQTPELMAARTAGVEIVGDVALFMRELGARESRAPVVAITGSNAKSTVTSWVGDMAQRAGLRVAVAGNIGKPVLSLLNMPRRFCVLSCPVSNLNCRDVGAIWPRC